MYYMKPLKSIRTVVIVMNVVILSFLFRCNTKEQIPNKENAVKTTESNASKTDSTKQILFFGNSLTAGYGLSEENSFPSLIQNIIDSLGLSYKTINGGLSGETTASGRSRLSWVLNKKVDVFVLELGANDGLRGIAIEETKRNLQAIIDTVQKVKPSAAIVLAGMKIPPNLGIEYGQKFEEIYPTLAEQNEIYLIPFLLKDVAGIKDLNLEDGIHPTEKGQKIVAKNVWKVLQKVVR